jgi:hypothetical protein
MHIGFAIIPGASITIPVIVSGGRKDIPRLLHHTRAGVSLRDVVVTVPFDFTLVFDSSISVAVASIGIGTARRRWFKGRPRTIRIHSLLATTIHLEDLG